MAKLPGSVSYDNGEDDEDNPSVDLSETNDEPPLTVIGAPFKNKTAADSENLSLGDKVKRLKAELGMKPDTSVSTVAAHACRELGVKTGKGTLKEQIDAAYAELFGKENTDVPQSALASTRTFLFQSPFDTNGILYWLGTARGTKPYVNPHKSGAVVASMSSKEPAPRPWGQDPRSVESRFVNNQVDHHGSYNTTGNMSNAWMAVDLGIGCALQVDHYSLRHGDFGSGMHKMQRWVLEGSSDGLSWAVLKEHNEPGHSEWMRGGAFCTGHWPVETSRSCRHFRIRMRGENHHHTAGNGLALLCAGIELYGLLVDSGAAVQGSGALGLPVQASEVVTVRMSADDHIDDVFYNEQSVRHLIPNIGSGVPELKVFQFTPVPGGVLAIAAHDNQPGNSASFFLEAKSTNPSSNWNFRLRPGHPQVKAWGAGHGGKPDGWHRNRFDDHAWTNPTGETHTHWSRHHGLSPGVWCQSHKFTAYRISPISSAGDSNAVSKPAQQAMSCKPVPNPRPQFPGNIFFKYKMHEQDGCMCENGACCTAVWCGMCAHAEVTKFSHPNGPWCCLLYPVPFVQAVLIADARVHLERKIWDFHRRHNDPDALYSQPSQHEGACCVALFCGPVMTAENLYVKRKFESWQRDYL